jgi:cell division protease FtsH
VTEWGMSELGPVTFGQNDEYVFLGKELHEARDYSEATAAKIDEQISKLIITGRELAENILSEHVDKLELVAQTLIEKETIEQAQFKKLMEEGVSSATSLIDEHDKSPTKAAERESGETSAGSAKPAVFPV